MKEEGNGFIESTTIARASRGAKMGLPLNDNKREHLHVARSSAKKMLADHRSAEYGSNLKLSGIR